MKNKNQGGFLVPEPYSPAAAARALYATTGTPANSCLSSCVLAPGVLYGSDVVSPGALGPAAIPRIGNMGGLNVGVDLGVYYDPSSVTMRAPIQSLCGDAAGTDSATVVTAPSMRHGPSAFLAFGQVPSDNRPATQFAPHGAIQVEKLELDAYVGPCLCNVCYGTECRPPYAFAQSVGSLLVTARNALKVRGALVAAGVVTVSPALEAATTTKTCACGVLGGPSGFEGLAKFALRYADTSIMQLLDVRREVDFLNGVYVSEVLAQVQSQVISNARANYARAEGPRAYLQPRLELTDGADDAADAAYAETLPEVLPGTGVRVSLEDSAFAARALLDPKACYANRVSMRCQTGLAIGEAPCVRRESGQDASPCPDGRCVLDQYYTSSCFPSFPTAAFSAPVAAAVPFVL